ncbi:hypothetical protein L218DRAFT_1001556 [Marasmius fiardii PR-910]|nr:hypothetical protein L218DRAFT_1001556 [Marasmius fiardii PR-910]
MLEPPSSSELLSNLDPGKLIKGQQSRSTAPAKNVDTSLWTETPAERQHHLADEVFGKKRKAVNSEDPISTKEALGISKRRRRDEEIRQSVVDHTFGKRKMRRSEGWDHSRDMALGARLMNDSSNKMIHDAKRLGDQFSTGEEGWLPLNANGADSSVIRFSIAMFTSFVETWLPTLLDVLERRLTPCYHRTDLLGDRSCFPSLNHAVLLSLLVSSTAYLQSTSTWPNEVVKVSNI